VDAVTPWIKVLLSVLGGFVFGIVATTAVGLVFFGDDVRGDPGSFSSAGAVSAPSPSPTTTRAPTTRPPTTRPPTTIAPVPTLPSQWELSAHLDLSEFECIGEDWTIGARGNLTNHDSVAHDVWVTVDLLDEPGEVRIDRLQTYVPGIAPGETVRFEVERYQGSAIRFMCEVTGLSRYANW